MNIFFKLIIYKQHKKNRKSDFYFVSLAEFLKKFKWAIPFNNHTGGGGGRTFSALIFWFIKCSYPLEKSKKNSNSPWILLQLYPLEFFYVIRPWKFLIQYPPGEVRPPPCTDKKWNSSIYESSSIACSRDV